MTVEERLVVLKADLQLLTNANDTYLTTLLDMGEKAVIREGITIEAESIECDMAIIHYAAYLFRRRAAEDTAMPRYLRWELNQLIFSQKARTNNDL